MSALIVLSSLMAGTFTASASNYSVEQLETLCETYEQKMDGSAYTNMLAAYEAWYNAKAYLVGVKTGLADAQDVDTYYTALESAIGSMGDWSAKTADATPSFVDDSTGTSYDGFKNGDVDYAVNILYWPGCTNYSANGTTANVTIDLYYPTTVLMYDGINTPTMPVMARASKILQTQDTYISSILQHQRLTILITLISDLLKIGTVQTVMATELPTGLGQWKTVQTVIRWRGQVQPALTTALK